MMNPMRTIVLGLMLFTTAAAEELVAPLDSTGFAQTETVIVVDDTLRVSAAPGQAFQVLLQLPEPGITSPVYALKGMVRHDAVGPAAYLQLDNHFGELGTFFTKSLAPSGPLQNILGTSEWRPFVLPFYANQGDQSADGRLIPDALTLSLYLPGEGVVELRDLGLYQYAVGEDPMGSSGMAGGTAAATLVGAIGGVLVGVWCAVVSILASNGKARGFVLGSATLLIVTGAAILATGVFALLRGQPYAVYYPMLLFGAIIVVVVGVLRRILPRRYEAVELQKMQSMDA